MSLRQKDGEVGYKRPPKSTQWKKGQCGNPKRQYKRASKGIVEIIDALFEEQIDIRENGVPRRVSEMLAAGCAAHLDLLNLCVWVKSNGGMGSLYRSRHELIFVFRNGKEQHRNNVQLGRFGRNRTNVWNYAGANSFPRKGQGSALDLHPTVKPIALVSDAILDTTKRNDIVLDPFCGSGTTILAAERTGRHGCGIEIDPLYGDTAIARWERMTGKKARHATGQTFADIKAERRLAP